MLLCPVRDCHQTLSREGHRTVCPQGHSFDIARSGYLNLLQPQERRSHSPGDNKAAVLARRRLHDRGIGVPFLEAIAEVLEPKAGDHLLDVGCGEGFFGANLAERTGCHTHGIDISTAAIELAARRYKESEWIVGNADRFIPYGDGTVDHVMAVTARMNAPEFRRVLKDAGKLLIAVPAADDLLELRGASRDRIEQTEEAFVGSFILTAKRRVTHRMNLDAAAINDLLLTIYRPQWRREELLRTTTITFSLDLLLFRPR